MNQLKRHKLGVVVPYRNRPDQLKQFLQSIPLYLKDIDHHIIVVDQLDEKDFNRGKLLNIGFIEAKAHNCDYVVFHDIDMLPVDVDYSYSNVPTHLVSKLLLPEGYHRDIFDTYFGGVTIFPVEIFESINGYTNEYFGWGFEDDNLLLRCKEVGISSDVKKVAQRSRDGVGLKFNGKNSFVTIPNTINTVRDFSIVVNFSVDRIHSNKKEITDEHSIFSIPGFDTALTYNSFRNFTFQFWKKDLSSMSITSEHLPEGTYTAVITIENRSDPKVVTFYLNGAKVGDLTYDKLKNFESKYIYLGVGDPERKEKQNWFDGVVNYFAIYNTKLEPITIKRISNNITKSLFSFEQYDMLSVYYDSKFYKGSTLIDLSGRNNDGYVTNCEEVITEYEKDKTVILPFRKKGVFKALPHEENGYKDGYWLNWKSRENQIDFYSKYYNKTTNFNSDGLSNCEYHIVDKDTTNNYTHLKVTL